MTRILGGGMFFTRANEKNTKGSQMFNKQNHSISARFDQLTLGFPFISFQD